MTRRFRTERGEVKVARQKFGAFGAFWRELLGERGPYLTAGSFVAFRALGRKRLLPTFSATPLAQIDEDHVRNRLASMVATVGVGKDRQQRPDVSVGRPGRGQSSWPDSTQSLLGGVPAASRSQELDYLRLDEIENYLEACSAHYRPLAQFLIGTGARVSEALAIQFRHRAPSGSRADLQAAPPATAVSRSRRRVSASERCSSAPRRAPRCADHARVHRRSASRAAKVERASTRAPVASTRAGASDHVLDRGARDGLDKHRAHVPLPRASRSRGPSGDLVTDLVGQVADGGHHTYAVK